MTRDELLVARTASWAAEERDDLATLVAELRPSPHHLGDALDWLDDVAVRDGLRPGAILAAPTLRAAAASPGSPPDRWKRWKEALRRLRFPRLAAREAEFAAAVRALGLGRTVTIAPPPSFEGGEMTITLRAATAEELATALERLGQATTDGTLARLFALLDA